MSMDPLIVFQGDDLPGIYFRVYDQASECYLDLSPSTTVITAKFRAKNEDTVLQTITCSKFAGGASGWVLMEWPVDALDVDAGRYEIELSVSFDGAIQTVGRYYMQGTPDDDDDVFELKVKEDF